MKIDSKDHEIRDLFAGSYFHIPRFQRPYSWPRENVQDFWDDVVGVQSDDYFLGSMVVYKDKPQRFGVVDGQQRLTTIIIFLATLRNALRSNGHEDLAKGVQRMIERENIDNKPEYTLATETSFPFFQEHVQKWGTPQLPGKRISEEEALVDAYNLLTQNMTETLAAINADPSVPSQAKEDRKLKKLLSIRDAVLGLKVIVVTLDTEDDAYVIFETLNTRGKNLALADLVKNHLAKHNRTANANVDQFKIKWQNLVSLLEGSKADLDVDTFIHHFWLSRYPFLPARSVFRTLRKKVGERDASQFLDNLSNDATLYRAIHDPLPDSWTKQEGQIATSIAGLRLFKVTQHSPCLLALTRAYRADRIKYGKFQAIVAAIENFHFLFTAVTSQRSSGGIYTMYATAGRRLEEAKDAKAVQQVLGDLVQKLRVKRPSIDEFLLHFTELIYTMRMSKQRNLARYVLGRFASADHQAVVPDTQNMTIEHLAPQAAMKGQDNVCGQMGNLLLIPGQLNERLRDRPFSDKLQILQKAGVVLSDDLKSASDWGPAEIAKRTEKMAVVAYNVHWNI
jgi:hypothetical protein